MATRTAMTIMRTPTRRMMIMVTTITRMTIMATATTITAMRRMNRRW